MSAPAALSTAPMAEASTAPRATTLRMSMLRHPFVDFVLTFALVIGAYLPALEGLYIWDDYYLVKNAPLIRSPLFCLEVFRHTLFDDASSFYRPAQSLTYIVDYWFWALDPYGYHLSNALIQAANGFLLFLLLRRLLPALLPETRRPAIEWTAVGLALVWVLHPVHSAAVAYISGRADTLAMMFCVSAWLLCERALAATRPLATFAAALGAAVCLLMGLCSKEIAFVWLVLFSVWLFTARPRAEGVGRFSLRQLAPVVGGLCLLGIYMGLRHLPNTPPAMPGMPAAGNRFVLMLRALGDYTRLMLFPHKLFMERQVFASTDDGVTGDSEWFYLALAIGGGVTLMAFALGAWLPGKGRTLRRFGAGWFLIAFVPISNLFVLNATVAEHWLYLPSIGFLLFLTGVFVDLGWKGARLVSRERFPAGAAAFALLAVVALGARTWIRAHDWVDALTFYQQTIRDGGNVPRARQGLATAYREKADPEKSIALLQDIAHRYPRLIGARANLGSALYAQGKKDEARATFARLAFDVVAVGLRTTTPREFAMIIRARDLMEPAGDSGWAAQRATLLETALQRFPDVWELAEIKMRDQIRAGDKAAALVTAENFHRLFWWHAKSLLATAKLKGQVGRDDEAVADCRQAARLDVHDVEAPDTAAILCAEQGRNEDAVGFLRDAVRREPESMRQHLLLAEVLQRAGHQKESAREKETATRMSDALPEDSTAL